MKDISSQFKGSYQHHQHTGNDVEFSVYYRLSRDGKDDYDSLVDLIEDTVSVLGGIEDVPADMRRSSRDSINPRKATSEIKAYHFPGQECDGHGRNHLKIFIEHRPDCYIVHSGFYRFKDDAFYLQLRRAILGIRP